MRRILSAGLCAVIVVATGCGKKTMQETAPPPAPPPAPAPAPMPEPPPPPAPEPVAAPMELVDAYFDYDSSELREDARTTLTTNGKQLVTASAAIQIEGHCDERGTGDYNLALGERRAQAAKEFLISYGVDGTRIETISYGENRPFAMGHDEAAWAQNRRAHFVVQ